MVQTSITIDTGDVIEAKTDDRGRLTLGSDYAGQEVEVAVLKTEERDAQPAD